MGFIGFLAVSLLFTFLAAYVAERRNRRAWLWGLLTFLFSPLVILILMALPKVPHRKPCPDCKELVLADANLCHYCGYRFRPGSGPNKGSANNAAG